MCSAGESGAYVVAYAASDGSYDVDAAYGAGGFFCVHDGEEVCNAAEVSEANGAGVVVVAYVCCDASAAEKSDEAAGESAVCYGDS